MTPLSCPHPNSSPGEGEECRICDEMGVKNVYLLKSVTVVGLNVGIDFVNSGIQRR